VVRIGYIISVVSVLYFYFILWEALVRHRPALSGIHIRTRIELIHSFPPINHSYTSIPVITIYTTLIKIGIRGDNITYRQSYFSDLSKN